MAESEEYLVLKQLTDVLNGMKIDYAIGGSIASLCWERHYGNSNGYKCFKKDLC